MGFNTTVVILNDGMGVIKDHPQEFVDNLIQKMLGFGRLREGPLNVACGYHANVAQVVECHHASETAVVAVGGNCGTLMGMVGQSRHCDTESQVSILKSLAKQMGYRLVKVPNKEIA